MQLAPELDRVLNAGGAAFVDLATAQHVDVAKWGHVIILDAPRPCDAPKLLAHCCKAPATLFLQTSEALMVPFLQRRVRRMSAAHAGALPLQYVDADEDTMPLDAVRAAADLCCIIVLLGAQTLESGLRRHELMGATASVALLAGSGPRRGTM